MGGARIQMARSLGIGATAASDLVHRRPGRLKSALLDDLLARLRRDGDNVSTEFVTRCSVTVPRYAWTLPRSLRNQCPSAPERLPRCCRNACPDAAGIAAQMGPECALPTYQRVHGALGPQGRRLLKKLAATLRPLHCSGAAEWPSRSAIQKVVGLRRCTPVQQTARRWRLASSCSRTSFRGRPSV